MKISSCNPHICIRDILRPTPQENKNKKSIDKPSAWLLRGYWEHYARKFRGDMCSYYNKWDGLSNYLDIVMI